LNGPIRALHGSNIFHRNRANDPTAAKASWATGKLYEFLRWNARPAALNHVFQRSTFFRAQAMIARRPVSSSLPRKYAGAAGLLC
jgi:hypothetical protein